LIATEIGNSECTPATTSSTCGARTGIAKGAAAQGIAQASVMAFPRRAAAATRCRHLWRWRQLK
jgi:hypothetical protein